MGLPIKHRKKYVSHKKRWDKQTIEDEKVLVTDYTLKNKREIRKVEFVISKYKKIAKELNRNVETKNSPEAKRFVDKLKALGYLNQQATSLDEILDITLRDILERRISNIIYKMKLARTPEQARQFVVHRHIKVGGKVVTSPSYSVSLGEETTVEFKGNSSLSDENHPERKIQTKGMDDMEKEMEEMPDSTPKEGDFDKKEEALDNEESDEVIE